VAESIGIGWRLPSESGGGINRNQVADCVGIRIPEGIREKIADSERDCPCQRVLIFEGYAEISELVTVLKLRANQLYKLVPFHMTPSLKSFSEAESLSILDYSIMPRKPFIVV